MEPKTRRSFLLHASAASAAALAAGCARRACPPATALAAAPTPAADPPPAAPRSEPGAALAWRDFEAPLVEADRGDFDMVVRGCSDTNVLRLRARAVPAGADLEEVAARMEATMRAAGGVGIAGPQVGLSLRVATLMLDYKTDDPTVLFARNPRILERADDTAEGYEGCLSIPGVGGLVRRNTWVRVRYETAEGEPIEVEAEGPNAVLWQHELDHLDEVLYIDKVLGELLPMEEVRRLRERMEGRGAPPPADPVEETRRLDSPEGVAFFA